MKIRINVKRAKECLAWTVLSIVGELIPVLSLLFLGGYCVYLYQEQGWKGIIQFLLVTLLVIAALVIVVLIHPVLLLPVAGGFLYWYLTGGDVADTYWEWAF
jgi:nitrate reductase NapE component